MPEILGSIQAYNEPLCAHTICLDFAYVPDSTAIPRLYVSMMDTKNTNVQNTSLYETIRLHVDIGRHACMMRSDCQSIIKKNMETTNLGHHQPNPLGKGGRPPARVIGNRSHPNTTSSSSKIECLQVTIRFTSRINHQRLF